MRKTTMIMAVLFSILIASVAYGQKSYIIIPLEVSPMPTEPDDDYPYYFAPPRIPPKPNFSTPLRDGLWGFGYELDRALWYNRYYRYRRLEDMIGPPHRPHPGYRNQYQNRDGRDDFRGYGGGKGRSSKQDEDSSPGRRNKNRRDNRKE